MEFTLSQHATQTTKERLIPLEWVNLTMSQPDLTEADRDDTSKYHAFRRIPEHGNRVLHVVFNRTKEPPHVVTAFFDRSMKEKL